MSCNTTKADGTKCAKKTTLKTEGGDYICFDCARGEPDFSDIVIENNRLLKKHELIIEQLVDKPVVKKPVKKFTRKDLGVKQFSFEDFTL